MPLNSSRRLCLLACFSPISLFHVSEQGKRQALLCFTEVNQNNAEQDNEKVFACGIIILKLQSSRKGKNLRAKFYWGGIRWWCDDEIDDDLDKLPRLGSSSVTHEPSQSLQKHFAFWRFALFLLSKSCVSLSLGCFYIQLRLIAQLSLFPTLSHLSVLSFAFFFWFMSNLMIPFEFQCSDRGNKYLVRIISVLLVSLKRTRERKTFPINWFRIGKLFSQFSDPFSWFSLVSTKYLCKKLHKFSAKWNFKWHGTIFSSIEAQRRGDDEIETPETKLEPKALPLMRFPERDR